MTTLTLSLPLDALVEMCRRVHAAARHEAVLAERLAGIGEECRAGDLLVHSFNNVLHQIQKQYPHPFLLAIPDADKTTEAIHLPALSSQLFEAVKVLAAPTLVPDAILKTWDKSGDAAYDDL